MKTNQEDENQIESIIKQSKVTFDEDMNSKHKKKKLASVLAFTFVLGATLTMISCSPESKKEKVDNAEIDVLESEQALVRANKEYKEDVKNYRVASRERIQANNQRIMEYNANIDDMNKEDRSEYKEKIRKLEEKNNDLKKRMNNYEADTNEDWERFKTEFNRDMDELGLALKNLVTDNK